MQAISQGWWRLVRFGFRLLYNEFAWTYDWVSKAVSLGHWREWQRASIPQLQAGPDDLILELAHGTGDLQIDMAAAGLKAIGLDISPYMGRITRRKLKRKGIEAKLVRGSAMQLPFDNETFRGVVSTFPTEFIVHPNTLREVYRVLKPQGRFIFVPNGMLVLNNPVSRFLEWLYQITGQRGPWPTDPLEAFIRAGFEAELKIEELPGSRVWIVVAVKPEH